MQPSWKKITTAVPILGQTKVLANLAMFFTAILWGVSFISIKIAVTEVPPITLALIRFMIATAILLIITRKLEPTSRLERKDLKKMVLAGALGITLYFYCENTGVKLTTASNASLITALIPVIAIVMDTLIFKTKISTIKLFGIGFATLGAYLAITANGQMHFNSATFQGNLFIVGAMLSWTFYTLLNKSLNTKYSGLFLTTYQTLFGTLLLLPASLLEYNQWQLFSLKALAHIIFLAVFCSAMCYFLYLYALERLDVTVTTLYLNLIPIIGVLSGHFILQERILPIQLWGGAIILIAILIVNHDNLLKRSPETKETIPT